MKNMFNSATVNVTLSDERFGVIYINKQTLELIDPVNHPFIEFRGSEASPIWYIIPHKVKPNAKLVFRAAKTMKGRKLVYKMNDYIDVEADINKFVVEETVLDGVRVLKFDASANTNIQEVNTRIVGELYDPFKLTTKKIKPITFSEYAPVPLGRGYHVEN